MVILLSILNRFFTKPQADLITDILNVSLSLIVILVACIYLYKRTEKKEYTIITLIAGLLAAGAVGLQLYVFAGVLAAIAPSAIACIMILGGVENKHKKRVDIKEKNQYITNPDDKEHLIDVLIRTAEILSTRQIGAIITIEKENKLNDYIQKSTVIDSLVSYELLESIFHPNTALHDGAVIIRGNRIECAGAFYPSSDKVDIPQHYGSRHRAAIGISEKCDAFTIVISEETGNIATTIAGTIVGNVTIDSLRTALENNILMGSKE